MDRRLMALRAVLVLEALTFLTAAALNFGARIPLGFVTVAFPVRIIPAAVAEAVIGGTLLAAGITLRRGVAWLGFWLTAGGIAFGLVANLARGGPELQVHAVMLPLALAILGLLVWTNRNVPSDRTNAGRYAGPPSLIGLMFVTAATLLIASLIHFGAAAPLGISDPFEGAAIPEAVLGALLVAGTVFLLSGRPGSREMALAATVFTLLLSAYGFSTTVRSARTGDVAYHIALLILLAGIIAGLLVSSPAIRRQAAR